MTKVNFYEKNRLIVSFYSLILGYNAMRLLSETQEEKYRTLNINPNMDDFYLAEQRNLFTQCKTLMSFINFIREDRDNVAKLENVIKAIREIENEY